MKQVSVWVFSLFLISISDMSKSAVALEEDSGVIGRTGILRSHSAEPAGRLRAEHMVKHFLGDIVTIRGSRTACVEEIETIPESKRDEILRIVKLLSVDVVEEWRVSGIIRAVKNIPEDKRDVILSEADTFFTKFSILSSISSYFPKYYNPHTYTEGRYFLIEVISDLPEDRRDRILETARRYISWGDSEVNKGHIIRAIAEIPEGQEYEVLRYADTFIPWNANGTEKARIIRAVTQIPEEQRGIKLRHVRSYINWTVPNDNIPNIINVIRDIPEDDIEDVLKHAYRFIVRNDEIIKVIWRLPLDQRLDVIDHTIPFIGYTSTGPQVEYILKSVAKTPKDQRSNIIHHANSYITWNMKDHHKAEVIDAIAQIPEGQRESIIKYATKFSVHGGKILTAIAQIPEDEIGDVIDCVITAMNTSWSIPALAGVIKGIAAVPEDQRVEIANSLTPFVFLTEGEEAVEDVIKIMAFLTPECREEIAKHYSNRPSNDLKKHILSFFRSNWDIMEDPREESILPLIPESASAKQFYELACFLDSNSFPTYSFEIRRIYKIAADKGYDEAQQLYAAMCRNGQGGERNREEARRYYKLAADQGLQSPMFVYAVMCEKGEGGIIDMDSALKYYGYAAEGGKKAAIHILIRVYEEGRYGLDINIERAEYYKSKLASLRTEIDVHHDTEESNTRVRIGKLYEVSGFDESDTNVRSLVGDFMTYLETQPEDIKLKAELTLSNIDGVEVRHFGPLLGNPLTCGGLDTTGDVFLARMWWWITTQFEDGDRTEIEREHAKLSLVKSLSDSIVVNEGVYERVCNEGKIARILEAVLSGRLEGCEGTGLTLEERTTAAITEFLGRDFPSVTVDESGVETAIPAKEQALHMENAAIRYMDSHPAINRHSFIRNVYAYIIKDILGDWDVEAVDEPDDLTKEMPNWRDIAFEE